MQTAPAINCSGQCLSVRLRWLEANLLSSRESEVLCRLQTKTLMARLLRLELEFFHSPREGGLLARVECLEAFVFGTETGRAAAMAECLNAVSAVDRIATSVDAETDGLRWKEDDKEESPGVYYIRRSAVIVTTDLKCRFGVVGELSRGRKVEVLEVATLQNEQLVRGRIEEPHNGWISLVSYETGYRWADFKINGIVEQVMRADHRSTDRLKEGVPKPPKRVRVEHRPHQHERADCFEDLGLHESSRGHVLRADRKSTDSQKDVMPKPPMCVGVEQHPHQHERPDCVRDLGIHESAHRHVMRSDCKSTDSQKDVAPKPPIRVRVVQRPHQQERPDCVEDLGLNASAAPVQVEVDCSQPVSVSSDRNGMEVLSSSGEADPQNTFYQVLAYPKLGMNLQIGRTYTQAELEERSKCSMPPPLGQRDLSKWVSRRNIFLEKLENVAFFRKVSALDA